jgi:DNA-binding transcriptional MerR regulator
LSSIRTEAGYRFYDDENTARIQQIVLLRKLRMPIAEIERIFLSSDEEVAIEALCNHLNRLLQEAIVLKSTTAFVKQLIQCAKSERNLPRLLSKAQAIAISELDDAPQIMPSERKLLMQANEFRDVRLLRIPQMVVASYRAESETPEKDCSEVMNRFILDNALHKKSGFRHFGFNHPSPSENNPVYGYEMWVAIPEELDVPSPLVKRKFEGGFYASIPTKLGEIGERWQQLYEWVKSSDQYEVDRSLQWLEECTDFETFRLGDETKKQLDLLEPIKTKES